MVFLLFLLFFRHCSSIAIGDYDYDDTTIFKILLAVNFGVCQTKCQDTPGFQIASIMNEDEWDFIHFNILMRNWLPIDGKVTHFPVWVGHNGVEWIGAASPWDPAEHLIVMDPPSECLGAIYWAEDWKSYLASGGDIQCSLPFSCLCRGTLNVDCDPPQCGECSLTCGGGVKDCVRERDDGDGNCVVDEYEQSCNEHTCEDNNNNNNTDKDENPLLIVLPCLGGAALLGAVILYYRKKKKGSGPGISLDDDLYGSKSTASSGLYGSGSSYGGKSIKSTKSNDLYGVATSSYGASSITSAKTVTSDNTLPSSASACSSSASSPIKVTSSGRSASRSRSKSAGRRSSGAGRASIGSGARSNSRSRSGSRPGHHASRHGAKSSSRSRSGSRGRPVSIDLGSKSGSTTSGRSSSRTVSSGENSPRRKSKSPKRSISPGSRSPYI